MLAKLWESVNLNVHVTPAQYIPVKHLSQTHSRWLKPCHKNRVAFNMVAERR